MPTPPGSDTDRASSEVQIRLLRGASIARRTSLAFSLTRTIVELARRSLARLDPGAGETEIGLRFVALNYGEDLARRVRQRISSGPLP